ncbi:hypothetical protein [Hyphomicrobium sp. MC1]|uniref:hypothetical protein n=1 Tax=Hyphomicrobium sp. (strain MC1) TaxID=717785 RepID=UPI000213D7D6|nr:hypothetical protein [Hyphomicrobium sp. MC1]CCB63754.1 protein of unknown function [Hyphomicrobium sp. MC1]
MRSPLDAPLGVPSLGLAEEVVATAKHLICRGFLLARDDVIICAGEVQMTVCVRKAMKRVKREEAIPGWEIYGEIELDDETEGPGLAGRIDLFLKTLEQFGDENNYLAVECKRVGAGQTTLNRKYVDEGVKRFATGQYANGHSDAFMLGYTIRLPVEEAVKVIDGRLAEVFGEEAKLAPGETHPDALLTFDSKLKQEGNHLILIHHIFVDAESP